MARSPRRALALVCLAAAALGAGPAARADVEETERRLKSAGVEDALRARIHAAIARGAEWLVARQDSDGAFRDADVTWNRKIAAGGTTALSALALTHVGSTAATRAAERGAEFLCPEGKPTRAEVLGFTYSAGLTAMLLDCLGRRPDEARRIVDQLTWTIDREDGSWGYGPTFPDFGYAADVSNLSTAQFAALGLWAGGRECGFVPHATWERHLRALCRDQAADGSWAYSRSRAQAKSGYATGTFMGLAEIGHPESLPWLAARITPSRGVVDVRATRAALAALARFDGGDAADRRAAARRVVRQLADLSRRAARARSDDVDAWTDAVHWRTLDTQALAALTALCTDPATGEPARSPDDAPLDTMGAFAAWLDASRGR